MICVQMDREHEAPFLKAQKQNEHRDIENVVRLRYKLPQSSMDYIISPIFFLEATIGSSLT